MKRQSAIQSKTAVVYKSHYGTTRQYAEWIAEALNADLYDLKHEKQLKTAQLQAYECLVFGGWLYGRGMLCKDFLEKHYPALKSKKLIVFSVGAAFNNDETLKAVTEANLDAEMQQHIRLFHLRGGLNYSSMRPLHRLMMFLLKMKLEGIPAAERSADARGIIATYGKDINFLKRDSIQPLIDYAIKG
ncbi:flavodoxin domain-containing protein [Spirochaeta dissipatitropha]